MRIIQNLAIKVLIGTKYVEKCIQIIFPMKNKVLSEHLAPVALQKKGAEVNVTTLLSREALMDEQKEHTTIGDAKLITTPAEAESQMDARTSKWA